MAEEQTPTPEVQDEAQENEQREMTNRDVKSDPLFKKVAGELKELRSQIAAEKAKQQKAQEAAELERLKEAGEYEAAIKMHAEKLERMEAQHRADLLKRDLTIELVNAGAKNDIFLNGAIAAYDGESTIAEYVQSLKEIEEHKPFFGGLEQSRQTQPSPRAASPNGGAQKSWDQVAAMEKSDDPKQRREAGKIIAEYFSQHGKMPPGME